MSRYTTELRYPLIQYCKDREIETDDINKVINATRTYLFGSIPEDTSESFWERFTSAFVNFFYMEEIGFETFYSFKIKLQAKITLLLDKYRAMISNYEHLFTYTWEKLSNQANKSNSESTGNSKTDTQHRYEIWKDVTERFSDTPQNALSDIASNKYLTSANINNYYDKLAEVNHDATSTNDKINTTGSINGTETIIDLDEMIKSCIEYAGKWDGLIWQMVNECTDLFMQVY